MKMKVKLARFISIAVLTVFALYLIPHEAVHVFYDHEDTEHCETHGTGTVFSEVHIHCDFLSTDITDFISAEEITASSANTVLKHHYAVVEVQALQVITALRESRGPPSLS